jgi:hypothetical protein
VVSAIWAEINIEYLLCGDRPRSGLSSEAERGEGERLKSARSR